MIISSLQKYFISGAIRPEFIAEAIGNHSSKTDIGAHSIFLGQVRADDHQGKQVQAIEYEAYTEMAEKMISNIRETIIPLYSLKCLHIYHSLGKVEVGGICLFVFCSAKHRVKAMHACSEIVDRLKTEVPVLGKEIFIDNSTTWKRNQ